MGYSPVLAVVMTQQASASEVARQTGVPLKRVHHRLTRLLGAGLIEVSAEQKRGGRAIRLYRALADEYTVPFELTDAATLEELMARMYRPFVEALVRGQATVIQATMIQATMIQATMIQQERSELRLRLDAAHQLMYNLGPRPDELWQAYGTAGTALLLPPDAQYLHGELRRLRAWATERHSTSDDARSYLLGLMFTPGELEE